MKTRDASLSQATVLVTGAASGLGAQLMLALLEAGATVRALDRVALREAWPKEQVQQAVSQGRLSWHRVDLAQPLGPSQADALVQGCSALVHAAALVSLSEEDAAFVPVNVVSVRALYEASARQGVGRFVLISCGSLYESGPGMLSESSPLKPQNGYERSKLEAEQVLRQASASQQQACPWTILRPAMLYGPYCHTMGSALVTLPPILHRFVSYLPGMTGGPRHNWCHVEDAAQAALVVLGDARSQGQTYNVADPTPLGFGELLTSMMEAYGLEVVGPLVPFPSGALSAAAPLLDHALIFDQLRVVMRQLWRRVTVSQGLDSPLRPRVDRKALFYVSGDVVLETSALRALGWRPKHQDYREGIVGTIRWYQERGWAPRYDSRALLEQRARERQRGFGFNEALSGERVDPHDGSTHTLRLDLDVELPPVSVLATRLYGFLDGQIEAPGLVPEARVEGTITIEWLGQASARYELGFQDAEGRAYRLEGRKTLSWSSPLESLTTLTGELVDARGRVISTVTLRFELSQQWVPLLVSMRFLMRARQERLGHVR